MSFHRLASVSVAVGVCASFASAAGTTSVNFNSTVGIKDGVLEWSYKNGSTTDSGADILQNFSSGLNSAAVSIPVQEVGSNLTFTVFGIVTLPAGGPSVITGFDPTVAQGIINTKSFSQVFHVNESQVAQDLQSRNTASLADLNNVYMNNLSLFANGSTTATLVSFTNGANRGTMFLTTTPEPAPFVALGLGSLAFVFRRRR